MQKLMVDFITSLDGYGAASTHGAGPPKPSPLYGQEGTRQQQVAPLHYFPGGLAVDPLRN